MLTVQRDIFDIFLHYLNDKTRLLCFDWLRTPNMQSCCFLYCIMYHNHWFALLSFCNLTLKIIVNRHTYSVDLYIIMQRSLLCPKFSFSRNFHLSLEVTHCLSHLTNMLWRYVTHQINNSLLLSSCYVLFRSVWILSDSLYECKTVSYYSFIHSKHKLLCYVYLIFTLI